MSPFERGTAREARRGSFTNIVSTPERHDDEFKFDLLASGPQKDRTRPAGIIFAAIAIVFIIATMTTGVATSILPMRDDYLNALIPVAPDGLEPLSLQKLGHEVIEKTTTVSGIVGNRSEYQLKDIRAVVEIQDMFGFPTVVEAPLDPPELSVQGTATFTASTVLEQGLGGYVLKFKVADGPFVPHKDDRGAASAPTAAPPTPPAK